MSSFRTVFTISNIATTQPPAAPYRKTRVRSARDGANFVVPVPRLPVALGGGMDFSASGKALLAISAVPLDRKLAWFYEFEPQTSRSPRKAAGLTRSGRRQEPPCDSISARVLRNLIRHSFASRNVILLTHECRCGCHLRKNCTVGGKFCVADWWHAYGK
jgi:hypothetical protein